MTVIEALEQLDAAIDQCEDPRSMALFSFGVAMGYAIKHGVTASDIASLDAMRQITYAARYVPEPKAPKQVTNDKQMSISEVAAKGGKARAKALSKEARSEAARVAVQSRWNKAKRIKPTEAPKQPRNATKRK